MERKEIAENLRWKLEDIFPDPDAVEAALAEQEALRGDIAGLKGTLAGGAGHLLAVLRAWFDAWRKLESLFSYAMMRKDEDNRAPASQALYERAQRALVQLEEAGSYIRPELLALPQGTLAKWQQQEAELGIYARFIGEIERMRAHALDEKGERLLAMAGEVLSAPQSIFTMIDNADIQFDPVVDDKGETVQMSHGMYGVLLENPDRRVRRDAFTSMFRAYERQKNTIGATYASSVKADVFSARARNFDSALAAALEPNEVPQAVYDRLIEAVEGNAPAMERYMKLRKRLLGIDDIEFYDLYVPIAREWDLKLPYGEAVEVVKKGLAPLGEEYAAQVAHAFENRWVDVCESEGKTSGAYSCGVHDVHPFILLNYQQSLDNVFTIAHEMGHAMHSYYSSKTQPYPTADYVIFVAEVASTVNELLLLDYLVQSATEDGARAALLNHKLETIRGTVYRQTLFAAFEKESHRMAEAGEPLTNDALCGVYADLYRRFYPGLEINELLPLEWMRIPHFYRAFYVYQYATGFSAAVALSRGLLSGDADALARYLNFLRSGGAKAPLDLLRDAGVDMTSPQPVDACMKEFEEALSQLEGLL